MRTFVQALAAAFFLRARFAVLALGAVLVASCGGGGNTTPPVNPTPTPLLQKRLWVLEGGLNQVQVLDAETGAVLKTISVGKTPAKMSYDSMDGSLWIANAGSNNVTKIDVKSEKVIGTVAVAADPEWIDASAVNSSYDVVWVASRSSKTVTLLNSQDMSVIQTVSTSGGPLTVDGYSGTVAEDNDRLVLFENTPPSANSTAAFTLNNGLQGALQIEGSNFSRSIVTYTAYDGKLNKYTPIGSTYTTGLSPAGTVQLTPGSGQVYRVSQEYVAVVNDVTHQVSEIDTDAMKVLYTTTVGNAPGGVTYDGSLYVANREDDTVSVLDDSNGNMRATLKLQSGAHPEDLYAETAFIPVTPTPSPSTSPTATPTATPTAAPTATPTPAPTSTPAATQHLYVANGSGGNLLEYASPFSASSTPVVNLKIGGNIWGVASDSNYVAMEDSTGFIYIFAQPLSASASPVAQFQGGAQGGQLYFDSSGNLYTAIQGSGVLEFSPPFSNSSTPSKTIFGDAASFSLTMDYNSNLYVGNLGMNQIDIYASPYTGSPTVVPQPGTYGLASYATYLYGADASSGKIDVYNLPMTAGSTPAFAISNTDPHGLAADVSSGTLYVGDQHGGGGSGSIDVYNQPLSGSSTAAYSISSGVTEPVQVWIGP